MNNENIKEILNKLGAEDISADAYKIAEQTSANFSKTLSQSGQPILWEHIMKSRIIKLAAAAVIVIAVLAGLPFFSSNTSSIVLADVLERVEQAQAYMYKMDMTMTETTNPEMTMIQRISGTIIVSNEYGTKSEMREKWEVDGDITDPDTGKTSTQLRYILPNRKLRVTIKPGQKKYRRTELDDDSLARMKKQNDDPREMMKQMLECEYAEMGRTVLNGIEVEGFETTDPKWTSSMTKDYEEVRVKLWVDVETWLPVLWETDTTINKQMSLRTVLYDFQWNIPVDASDFEPVIPDDYTSIADDKYKWPVKSEQDAMEGLKFFAETMRQYPTMVNLKRFRYGDYPLLMREIRALKERKDLTDSGKKLYEEMEQLTGMERMHKIMTLLQPVQSLGGFYMLLEKYKKWDPAYYGDTVTVQDVEKVLLRWKISDNQYRVIFGDLSALDVSTEELAELEK